MKEKEFRIVTDGRNEPGTAVERDGVHFGYYASGAERPELLLYRKGSSEVEARLPFPEPCAPGRCYSMKVKLRASAYEYNFSDGGEVVVDPYARRIAGRGAFGSIPDECAHAVRGGFITRQFDWEGDCRPQIPYEDVVAYQLHVRGFTKQRRSGVRRKGTYAGLAEKLPYLKSLGVNQLCLMPCYDFAELRPARERKDPPGSQREAQEQAFVKSAAKDSYRMNYWGYGPGFYFAPKASYAASQDEDVEFKSLVKAAHRLGMEVLMEFAFAEEADILMIGRCLLWWAAEYHVDGFAVVGRDGLGTELASLPLFGELKLVCGWYSDQVLQRNAKRAKTKGCLPAQLAESNDGFLIDCRRLLKGDEGALEQFVWRQRRHPRGAAVVNYITHHDGFTLADLVSYDRKYNLENGEQDQDGTDYNFSWNCGVEGPTKRKDILRLRRRQQKNALAMLLLAQGTPMLLAGDEFGNSQGGNNNPYCHDSELTWLCWDGKKAAQELTGFVRDAIVYRLAHRVLRQAAEPTCTDSRSGGYPDLSYHGDRAWYCEFDRVARHVGCLYSGSYAGEKGFVYLAYNLYWNVQEFALPLLPKGMEWYLVMDTGAEKSFLEEATPLGRIKSFQVPDRTIMILEGR